MPFDVRRRPGSLTAGWGCCNESRTDLKRAVLESQRTPPGAMTDGFSEHDSALYR